MQQCFLAWSAFYQQFHISQRDVGLKMKWKWHCWQLVNISSQVSPGLSFLNVCLTKATRYLHGNPLEKIVEWSPTLWWPTRRLKERKSRRRVRENNLPYIEMQQSEGQDLYDLSRDHVGYTTQGEHCWGKYLSLQLLMAQEILSSVKYVEPAGNVWVKWTWWYIIEIIGSLLVEVWKLHVLVPLGMTSADMEQVDRLLNWLHHMKI